MLSDITWQPLLQRVSDFLPLCSRAPRKMKRFASFMLIADPPLCSGGCILIQFEILCFHDDNSNAGERLKSDELRGGPIQAPLPEVLKATAESGTTKSNDGIGTSNSPVHS